MNKKIFVIAILSTLMFTACRKYEDFPFSGTVIGSEYCSSLSSIQDLAYLVAVDQPDSIGRTFTSNGTTYKNVVVLYESPELLKFKYKIQGTMFLSEDYSKANCGIHYTDRDLPEGVFTSVEVLE